MQPLDVAVVRLGQRAEQADARIDHEGRRGEAGEQGHLGVPALDRQHVAELQAEPVALDVHLLLQRRQVDAAAGGLAGQPELAELLEQEEDLAGGAAVDLGLGLVVAHPPGGADARTDHLDVGARPLRVEPQRPQERRPDLVGQQRRGALRQHLGVQRDLRVGAVQRLAARVGLQVDRVAGGDERREVGDRVRQHVAVAVTGEVQRLVEVHRAGRVDGDQRELGAVEVRQARVGGRLLGRGLDVGRERREDLELGLDVGDPGAEGVGGDALGGLGPVEPRSDGDHATTCHVPDPTVCGC